MANLKVAFVLKKLIEELVKNRDHSKLFYDSLNWGTTLSPERKRTFCPKTMVLRFVNDRWPPLCSGIFCKPRSEDSFFRSASTLQRCSRKIQKNLHGVYCSAWAPAGWFHFGQNISVHNSPTIWRQMAAVLNAGSVRAVLSNWKFQFEIQLLGAPVLAKH